MNFRVPLCLLATAGVLVGCDYVDQPLGEDLGPGPGEGVTRRVLLEDFTGHTCTNCPAATEIAFQLQAVYGEENLILVGVHAGDGFNEPIPPIGDDYFDTDFRTPAGEAYKTTFSITFLPSGLVSRKPFNGPIALGDGSWSSAVADIIGEPADMDVWIDTLEYNSGTNSLHTTVKVALVNDVVGDHNLTIYLLEDHVIDWQIDEGADPDEVPDYDHRHVLRDNVNGTWGDTIIVGFAGTGDTLSLGYDYVLAPNVLNPDNCALVAYVYSMATNEVMQVAERKFQD